MCSASQPSSRACTLAMRSAKHFLPRSALPPYPEPTDQMSFSSGKWRMKRRSGLRSPSECRPFTKSSRAPSCFMAAAPMRVMMRMLATTYGLVLGLGAVAPVDVLRVRVARDLVDPLLERGCHEDCLTDERGERQTESPVAGAVAMMPHALPPRAPLDARRGGHLPEPRLLRRL